MKKLLITILTLMLFCVLLSSGCVNNIIASSDPIVGTWKYEKPITSTDIGTYGSKEIYNVTYNYPDYRITFCDNNTRYTTIGEPKIVRGTANGDNISDRMYIKENIEVKWNNTGNGTYLMTGYDKRTGATVSNSTAKLENGFLVYDKNVYGRLVKE